MTSDMTTQEAEDAICVDDDGKMDEVCITDSQLTNLTESHGVHSLSYNTDNNLASDGTMY